MTRPYCRSGATTAHAPGLHLETQRTNIIAQTLHTEQGWEADEEFCTYHLRVKEH